jgi:hypothetical protein
MSKPKKRFFIIAHSHPELDYGCVMTKEEAQASAACIAVDSDEYIYVAELHETHYQVRESSMTAYMADDAEYNKHE